MSVEFYPRQSLLAAGGMIFDGGRVEIGEWFDFYRDGLFVEWDEEPGSCEGGIMIEPLARGAWFAAQRKVVRLKPGDKELQQVVVLLAEDYERMREAARALAQLWNEVQDPSRRVDPSDDPGVKWALVVSTATKALVRRALGEDS